MQFLIVEDDRGQTIGCATTKQMALAIAMERGVERGEITRVDVPVTAESIRRLLAQSGGYATEVHDPVAFYLPAAEGYGS